MATTDKKILYGIAGIAVIAVIIFLAQKMGAFHAVSSGNQIKEMIAGGAPKQCTFQESAGIAETDGIIYMNEGKMRADFNSTDSGVVTKAHIIMSNGFTYTWVDGLKTGFKVETPQNGSTEAKQPLNIDAIKNPACMAWTADNSMFNLPMDVSFPTLPASQ